MDWPKDIAGIAHRLRDERTARSWSTTELARRATGVAREQGDPLVIHQQQISQLENEQPQKVPNWLRYVKAAFLADADETKNDPYLSTGRADQCVMIQLLPTHVGLGS